MFSDRLLEPEWVPVLSFLLFGSLLTVGQIIKFNSTSKNQMIADRYQGKSFQLVSWRTLICLILVSVVTFLMSVVTLSGLRAALSHVVVVDETDPLRFYLRK